MNTIAEIAAVIRKLKSALIFTHVRPDGDTVGCGIALSRALAAGATEIFIYGGGGKREDHFLGNLHLLYAAFKAGDFLVFGKESKGLPEELLMDNRDTWLGIPMIVETRSLNLSNSVAVAVYEGLRQLDFDGFKTEGQLHKHKW